MERIQNLIQEAQTQGKALYIRGTSNMAMYLGVYMQFQGIKFEGYTDNNPEKWGKAITGEYLCYPPQQIPQNSFVFITAYTEKNQKEIAAELEAAGISYATDLFRDIYECIKVLDDKEFLQIMFKARMGYELNLENPRTLCEKIQWIKLYDRKPLYTKMVDKYEAKKYVGDLVGEQYIIPAYGVWDSFDEIDFDQLPKEFVLKWTHDSGSLVVVEDKDKMNKAAVKERMHATEGINYFYFGREWAYKNVKPRIIAEKYINSLGKRDSIEYKVSCLNGKVECITICQGIAHSTLDVRTNDSYDTEFNHMPWYAYYKNSKHGFEKPKQWEELIEISEKLATGIPYLRVDFYVIDGQIYFGENTFYSWGGYIDFQPSEWDLKAGDCLILPKEKTIE